MRRSCEIRTLQRRTYTLLVLHLSDYVRVQKTVRPSAGSMTGSAKEAQAEYKTGTASRSSRKENCWHVGQAACRNPKEWQRRGR